MKRIEKRLYKEIVRRFDKIEPELWFNIHKLIKSLGEPSKDNGYKLYIDKCIWWIEHNHVGSGEPLNQFLQRELKSNWVKVIDLEFNTLYLNEIGKLWTDNRTYFLNKKTVYCLLPELEELIKELNKLG